MSDPYVAFRALVLGSLLGCRRSSREAPSIGLPEGSGTCQSRGPCVRTGCFLVARGATHPKYLSASLPRGSKVVPFWL